MKLCITHLLDLKNALTGRGLGSMFDAQDDGEPSLIIQATGPETRATYNPLTSANAMLRAAALKVGGMYLLRKDLAGNEYCPICEGIKGCKAQALDEKLVTVWITQAADAVADYVKRLPAS
jgi:hypothetical protein